MKRFSLMVAYLVIITGLLCGCVPYKTNNRAMGKNENTSASQAKKTKLTLLFYYEGQERFSLIDNLCIGFNNEQKELEVIPEFVPYENLKKRLITGFADGTPPDIVIFDKPDQAYLAENGILADISQKIDEWIDKSQYFEGSIESCTYKGRMYGVPFGENCLELFYNKKIFASEKLKPPKTWEELRATAKKLSKDNVKGIGISAQDSEQGMFQFLPWFFSAGASLKKLDSPEAIRAFTFMTDLVEDGSMSVDVINLSQADVMRQFADENIAMMINGPWQLSELKLKAPGLEYGVVKIPMDKKSVTILGGENIGVTEGLKKGEAFKFIKYVCKPENVKALLKAMGYFPPRKDVAAEEIFTDSSITKVFSEGMQNAISRGVDTQWPKISEIVTKALHEALSQSKTPETAARDAQISLKKLLKQQR